jgi:hypothetical protein
MVWFPILGENRLGQFRMVMNAAPAIRDAEICPHPAPFAGFAKSRKTADRI